MHPVAFLGISLLVSLRIFGLFVSIEFRLERKESHFIILIIGWSSWIVAGLFALATDFINDQFFSSIFLLINSISATLAMSIVLIGLHSYFRETQIKTLAVLTIIFVSIPVFAFILGQFTLAFNISAAFLFFVVLIYSLIPLFQREIFKSKLSGKSFFWYLIVLSIISIMVLSYIVSIIQGHSFGFYSEEYSLSMFINYFVGNISTIAILVYFIHLEYDIFRTKKDNLRDKYSHDLGNIVQVIYSAIDLANVDDGVSKEKSENLKLIEKKCEEAAKLIKDIKETQ